MSESRKTSSYSATSKKKESRAKSFNNYARKSNLLITQSNYQNLYDEKLRKDKVKEDIIQINSNLSMDARKRLMNKKLDEKDLYSDTRNTLKKLMKEFSLKDTRLFENKRLTSSSAIPLQSKKTLNFLKNQFNEKASKKAKNSKQMVNRMNYYLRKHQRLKILKEGNRMRHKTTHLHQLNLVKQANDTQMEGQPRFFQELIKRTSGNLGLINCPNLRNTGILPHG